MHVMSHLVHPCYIVVFVVLTRINRGPNAKSPDLDEKSRQSTLLREDMCKERNVCTGTWC